MSTAALSVQNLYQAHTACWILQDISFEVKLGTIAVLTGVNGVGKTTLLSTIVGMKSATKGSVSVFGHKRRVDIEGEIEARRNTVYLPHNCFLPSRLTVQDYLAAAGTLFEVPDQSLPDRINALLSLFALEAARNQRLSSISAGQKQKVALASALLSDRKLLVLDEPFSGGLDPAGIMALRRVLKHQASANGQTILLSTPVTELVTELADQLLVLRDGMLAHNLTRAEILASVPPDSNVSTWLEGLVFPDIHERVDEFVSLSTHQAASTP
jgi:ABC-type multidrug transport system ATPase subunit